MHQNEEWVPKSWSEGLCVKSPAGGPLNTTLIILKLKDFTFIRQRRRFLYRLLRLSFCFTLFIISSNWRSGPHT